MVYGGAWYECGTQGNWLEHLVAVFGLCLANYIRLERLDSTGRKSNGRLYQSVYGP